MAEMKVYVSEPDNLASFGDIFFDVDEADKMVKFAESLGYTVTKEDTDRRFADNNSPFRKDNVRDIDWADYKNILYIIDNRDKTDEEIVRGLKSKGSGFSITVKRGKVMTAYSNALEKITGPLTKEMKIELAKTICGKFMSGKKSMQSGIDYLKKKGCTAGIPVGDAGGYPECVKGFNSGCPKCPHNKDAGLIIKTPADIDRYNIILKENPDD